MNINVTVAEKRATVIGTPVIVCGNSDYSIEFAFDAEWEGLEAKTARFVFVQNGAVKYQEVIFTGNTVAVPVLTNTKEVRVGVFAGDLHTTTPAIIRCDLSILCGTGAVADPTPDQYNQIMALLNKGGGAAGGSVPASGFSKRLWDSSKKKGKYEAWPFGNAWFDKDTGKHCLIVDVKSSHTSTDGDVYFTSKYDFGEFENPVLVAQHTSAYGCRTHGSGINAKGEYLALVLHYNSSGNGPLHVYKSTDKGKTWTSRELLIKRGTSKAAEAAVMTISEEEEDVDAALVTSEFKNISINDNQGGVANNTNKRIGTPAYINSGIASLATSGEYYFSVHAYEPLSSVVSCTPEASIDFCLGSIDNTEGTTISYRADSPRVRSTDYLATSIQSVAANNTNLFFAVFVYSENGSYVGNYDGANIGTFTWLQSADLTALHSGGYRVKLIVKQGEAGTQEITPYAGAYDGTNIGTFAWLQSVDLTALHNSGYFVKVMMKNGSAGTNNIDPSEAVNMQYTLSDGTTAFVSAGKNITGITASYTGGNVEVGTDVSSLSGVTVTAHYSDGTSSNVTGYSLSGTITEGANTVTVSYNGFTTSFIVTGTTEPEETEPEDGENLTSGETGSCFLTSSGRLLSFDRLAPSPSAGCMIIYSDDHGASWSGTMIDNGTAPNPLEGSFIELSNGNIYCVVRGHLYTGNFTVLQKTYITKSTDGGTSWTPLMEMEDIDATFNGVALIHHAKSKKVEMLYASRLLQKNGCGSLYRRICTEEEFEAGYYGEEVKIANGGSVGADFGYVAASVSNKNVVNMYYYITDNQAGGVCIMNAELDWIY